MYGGLTIIATVLKYRRHLKKEKPKETFLTNYDEKDEFLETAGIPGTSPACICDDNNSSTKKEMRLARKERRRQKRKNKKRRRSKRCKEGEGKCLNGRRGRAEMQPLWNSSYRNLQSGEKLRRRDHPACKRENLDFSIMDNTHWKTQPYWTYGPFCFCTNSINNTYWCLRTVNSTHDLLYCEFINNFISYYDLIKDPFQLKNAIHDVNYGVLQQLHEQLIEIRKCSGYKECNKASQSTKQPKNTRLLRYDYEFQYDDLDDT